MIRSFAHAFRGIWLLIRTERNFQIHCAALVLVVAAGIYFDIHRIEWIAVLGISALVLALEGVNTSLEKLCDEVTEERKESIKNIKDIAAGAVLIAAIIAVGIAIFVFWPYIME